MKTFKQLLEATGTGGSPATPPPPVPPVPSGGSALPPPPPPGKKGKKTKVTFTKPKRKVKREEPTSLIGSIVSSIAGDIMKTATKHGYQPTEVASDAIRRKEHEEAMWKAGKDPSKHRYDDEELYDRHGRRVVFRGDDGGGRRKKRKNRRGSGSPSVPPVPPPTP